MGKKRKVVGEVPFETGVPEPKVKSPLDRHTMEKQMVAETIISYGFDSWFDDEPAKTDESDSLFEDYDTGAIDDLFQRGWEATCHATCWTWPASGASLACSSLGLGRPWTSPVRGCGWWNYTTRHRATRGVSGTFRSLPNGINTTPGNPGMTSLQFCWGRSRPRASWVRLARAARPTPPVAHRASNRATVQVELSSMASGRRDPTGRGNRLCSDEARALS